MSAMLTDDGADAGAYVIVTQGWLCGRPRGRILENPAA
jgi:hypothetical protein